MSGTSFYLIKGCGLIGMTVEQIEEEYNVKINRPNIPVDRKETELTERAVIHAKGDFENIKRLVHDSVHGKKGKKDKPKPPEPEPPIVEETKEKREPEPTAEEVISRLSSLCKGGLPPDDQPTPPKPIDEMRKVGGEFIIELAFESDTKDDELGVIPVETIIIGPNDPSAVNIPERTKEMKKNNLKVDIVRPRVFKRVI